MAEFKGKHPAVQYNHVKSLGEEAAEIRRDIVDVLQINGGHYGGALSVSDILLTLYRRVLKVLPDDPAHALRDRLVLSKGHACIALYAVLAKVGYFSPEELSRYGCMDSFLEGHPDMLKVPGIDFSTGSLGQGVSIGLGMAIALKNKNVNVWVVLGDGECQEGQVWEAAMVASRYKITNLFVVVDSNGYQELGWHYQHTFDTAPVSNQVEKWRSFGWHVREVDGHDHEALERQFKTPGNHDQPTVFIAKTTKGFGYPLTERDPLRFHCTKISADEHNQLRA